MATTVSLKPNAVEISGSTSGTTTLQATAVAGTTTLTLPAATDTLVGRATTDTLTNKTLTSPTITGTLTTTGNTILGDASTDTLNVGDGDLVKTATGNLLVGNATSYAGKFQSWGAVTANAATPNLVAIDTTSMVSGVGGELAFIGQYQVGDYAYFGSIRGIKENGTSGNTACALAFFTRPNGSAPTEAGRFNSTGAFVLAGGTTTANGIGITFPATQSASTDANTLDDYEEGTWTPIFLPETNSFTSSTYDIQSGRYTKIGRVVYFDFALRTASLTIGTATDALRISGLPFTVSSSTQGTAMIGQSESWGGDFPSGAFIRASTQLVSMLYRTTANGVTSSIQVSDMSTSAASNEVTGGGFYII